LARARTLISYVTPLLGDPRRGPGLVRRSALRGKHVAVVADKLSVGDAIIEDFLADGMPRFWGTDSGLVPVSSPPGTS
jgi:hypothetical protein